MSTLLQTVHKMKSLEEKLPAREIRNHKNNPLHLFCRVMDYYRQEQKMPVEYALVAAKQKMYTLYGERIR